MNSQIGGEVYTELPCKTNKQGRRPDVAYLTPELVSLYGHEPSLPQSPSLVAEIASPDDSAEDLFAKAHEYLASGCREVWVILPENKCIFIMTEEEMWAFNSLDILSTQKVLQGFQVGVNELLS
jgi:Uma2 family endonuclease